MHAAAPTSKAVLRFARPGVGRGPHRELGFAPQRRFCTGKPRQRRPNQPAMDWSLGRTSRRAVRVQRRDNGLTVVLRDDPFGFLVGRLGRRHDPGNAVEYLLIKGARYVFLLPLGRHFGVLVVVLGVARRAPGLFDLVAHHGDDGVVRDPALARTVIVHDISESRLALLHQAP